MENVVTCVVQSGDIIEVYIVSDFWNFKENDINYKFLLMFLIRSSVFLEYVFTIQF
jgi:hypothetical protein